MRWENGVLLSPYYLDAGSCNLLVHQVSSQQHQQTCEPPVRVGYTHIQQHGSTGAGTQTTLQA